MIFNTVSTIATLVLANYGWAQSPSLWTCALFWSAALLLIAIWAKRLSPLAVGLLAAGGLMNFAVTAANGGFMPVVGRSADAGSGLWVSSQTHDNLLILADRMALFGASPGDFVILLGLIFHLSGPFLRGIGKLGLARRNASGAGSA